MKRFVLLGMVLGAAGCGDNLVNGTPADAARADAAPDAAPPADARPDAPPPPMATHSGTISVFDVRLKNMGGQGVDGHGVQIGISFVDLTANTATLIMEETSSLTDGCKLWELSPAQLAASIGTDQGPVTVTAMHTTPPTPSPVFPACIFFPGSGYACPDGASSGADGILLAELPPIPPATMPTPAPPGTHYFLAAPPIPPATVQFGPEDVGRYLRITGVGSPNTAFPIVAVGPSGGPPLAVVATGGNPALNNLPAPMFATLAGVGPMPGATPDTFFTDLEKVTLTKPASANFEAFPANTGFTGTAGIADHFELGVADPDGNGPLLAKVLPTTIPTTGEAFAVGCDNEAACGAGLGTILNIVTTDGTPSASPFSFPAPLATGKRIQLRCIEIGSTTITVPAAYSARLIGTASTPNTRTTRIQTQFIRANQNTATNATGAPNTTNIAGGHAEVGFTIVPPAS